MKNKILISFVLLIPIFLLATKIKSGKDIYFKTCISCHGIKGLSENNIKLAVKPRLLAKSILNKEQLKNIISEGSLKYGSHSVIMPGFKQLYNKKEIENVTNYVYKKFYLHRQKDIENILKNSNIDSPSLKIGEKIFKKNFKNNKNFKN